MSKERPKRPKPRRNLQRVDTQVETRIERVFEVVVTDPENSVGLLPGQDVMLRVGEADTTVLRDVVVRLGTLERAGDRWVRTHRYRECVFAGYGPNPEETFQVRIAAW